MVLSKEKFKRLNKLATEQCQLLQNKYPDYNIDLIRPNSKKTPLQAQYCEPDKFYIVFQDKACKGPLNLCEIREEQDRKQYTQLEYKRIEKHQQAYIDLLQKQYPEAITFAIKPLTDVGCDNYEQRLRRIFRTDPDLFYVIALGVSFDIDNPKTYKDCKAMRMEDEKINRI